MKYSWCWVKMGGLLEAGSSISLIRKVENERYIPINMGGKFVEGIDEFEEDDPDALLVSRLCGDLTDEMMDNEVSPYDGGLVDIPVRIGAVGRKKKIPQRK